MLLLAAFGVLAVVDVIVVCAGGVCVVGDDCVCVVIVTVFVVVGTAVYVVVVVVNVAIITVYACVVVIDVAVPTTCVLFSLRFFSLTPVLVMTLQSLYFGLLSALSLPLSVGYVVPVMLMLVMLLRFILFLIVLVAVPLYVLLLVQVSPRLLCTLSHLLVLSVDVGYSVFGRIVRMLYSALLLSCSVVVLSVILYDNYVDNRRWVGCRCCCCCAVFGRWCHTLLLSMLLTDALLLCYTVNVLHRCC